MYGMNQQVKDAIEAVRETLNSRCSGMEPEDYKEVLENISADCDGNLDALMEENPELKA